MPDPLRVAYEEADITPAIGGSMPGYFRDRAATGVFDPLKAKVLVLAQANESIALVACDLIGMGAPLVARIRERITKTGRNPPRHVWVHCTHTHTGGQIPRNDMFTSDTEKIYPNFYAGRVDEAWIRRLIDSTASAVNRAMSRVREERQLSLHTGRETTVAFYRRFLMKDGTVRTNPGRNNPNVVRPVGQIDPRIHVLRFETSKILVVLFGLHPDCVSGPHYSADYPYHLTEALRHALGIDWRVLFLNTCCGNINHINVNNPNQRGGYLESRRIGQALALSALDALRQGPQLPLFPLRMQTRVINSRLRRPRAEDVKEAEELLRTYLKTGRNPFGFNELFAPAALVLARTQDREHRAEVGALRLGDFGLATMPAEMFVEFGQEIEDGSPWRPTRTIGLTNGSMGYVPTRRGHVEGGYEAGYRSARYEPETGHRWAAAALEMLRALK